MQSEMKNSPERKKKAPAATSKFDALGTPKHNTSRPVICFTTRRKPTRFIKVGQSLVYSVNNEGEPT